MAKNQSSTAQLTDRYSEALLELAQEQQAVDTIERELAGLKKAVNDNAELKGVVESPLLKRDQQQAAMQSLVKQSGGSDLIQKFIGLLAQKRRLFLISAIADRFAEILRERRGEAIAHVTVARELNEEQKTLLSKTLAERLGGRKVQLSVNINPDILGGLIVRVGSVQIDDSLRTKLNTMSTVLKGA